MKRPNKKDYPEGLNGLIEYAKSNKEYIDYLEDQTKGLKQTIVDQQKLLNDRNTTIEQLEFQLRQKLLS